jgi:hypothetical protein
MRVFISKAKELREVFGFVEQSSVDIHAFLLKHLKKSEIAELESKIESKERNVKVSKLSSLKRLSLNRGQSHDLRLSFDETACNTTIDRHGYMGTGNDGNIPGFVICFDLILKYIITVTY